MGKFVSGLFGGTSGRQKGLEQEAKRERELQRIAQSRAEEEARANQDESAKNYGAGKNVRGRRLLESAASGGLALTLGSA